jgi:hypothetical protein
VHASSLHDPDFAVLLLGALAPAAQASWSPVGDAVNVDPTKDALSPSIATVGGVPYVAWKESTLVIKAGKATVATGTCASAASPPRASGHSR